MLTVKGKSLGSRKPLFADFSVPVPDLDAESDPVTVRRLIELVVQHEVEMFHQRQTDRQFLRVLTQKEIDAGEAAGKIESGESEIGLQEIDLPNAIQVALDAFRDGIYLFVVDETEQKSLDAVVPLTATSSLTFIRLTLLAGG